ncbi:hypothetical protein F4810DRAFT_670497, partial [Camillea tinctor]
MRVINAIILGLVGLSQAMPGGPKGKRSYNQFKDGENLPNDLTDGLPDEANDGMNNNDATGLSTGHPLELPLELDDDWGCPPKPSWGSPKPSWGPTQPSWGHPEPSKGPPELPKGPPEPPKGPPEPPKGPPQPSWGEAPAPAPASPTTNWEAPKATKPATKPPGISAQAQWAEDPAAQYPTPPEVPVPPPQTTITVITVLPETSSSSSSSARTNTSTTHLTKWVTDKTTGPFTTSPTWQHCIIPWTETSTIGVTSSSSSESTQTTSSSTSTHYTTSHPILVPHSFTLMEATFQTPTPEPTWQDSGANTAGRTVGKALIAIAVGGGVGMALV